MQVTSGRTGAQRPEPGGEGPRLLGDEDQSVPGVSVTSDVSVTPASPVQEHSGVTVGTAEAPMCRFPDLGREGAAAEGRARSRGAIFKDVYTCYPAS